MAVLDSVTAEEQHAQRWAALYLTRRGYPAATIWRVSGEAIVFVSRLGAPMTGWLRQNKEGIEPDVRFERGWPVKPADGMWSDDKYADYVPPGKGAE